PANAVAVDYVGVGPSRRSVESAASLVVVADRQEGNAVISQESVIGIAIHIDADPYHRYSPGLHPFAHTDQGRNFFHAGCAPGRPKIEHDNLPMQLAQGDAAVGVLHCERSEEHTSELQSRGHLVCRLLLEKKKTQ